MKIGIQIATLYSGDNLGLISKWRKIMVKNTKFYIAISLIFVAFLSVLLSIGVVRTYTRRMESPLRENLLLSQNMNLQLIEIRGKMVKVFADSNEIEQFSRDNGIPVSEIQRNSRRTLRGIEVPFNNYIEWLSRNGSSQVTVCFAAAGGSRRGQIGIAFVPDGSFRVIGSRGFYYIATVHYRRGTSEETDRTYWNFRLNNGPLNVEINPSSIPVNGNNKFSIFDESYILPIEPPF